MSTLTDATKLQMPLDMPVPNLRNRMGAYMSDAALAPMVSSAKNASKMMRSVSGTGV